MTDSNRTSNSPTDSTIAQSQPAQTAQSAIEQTQQVVSTAKKLVNAAQNQSPEQAVNALGNVASQVGQATGNSNVTDVVSTTLSMVQSGQQVASAIQSGNPSTALSGAAGGLGAIAEATDSPVMRSLAQTTSITARTFEEVMGGIEAVTQLARDAAGGDSPAELPKVSFLFQSEGAPDTVWRVYKLHITEGISELYQCTLHLANEDLEASAEDLLGQSCEVAISREDHIRRLCGIVQRVEMTGTQAGHQLCMVSIVPAFAALEYQLNSRIFQELSAEDIIKKVLDESLSPYQRKYEFNLQRPRHKREYCLQYHESNLALVKRLLEDEGIAFYFDHSDSKEKLLFVDQNSSYPSLETMDGGPVTITGPEQGTASIETVRHFDWAKQIGSTSVVVRDYDWTQPLMNLTKEIRAKDLRGKDREVFIYPGDPTIGSYDEGSHKYTREDIASVTKTDRERFIQNENLCKGEANVITFGPGAVFPLSGHRVSAWDQKYLLTRVEHFGEAPEQLTNDSRSAHNANEQRRYYNRFSAIANTVQFRPAKVTPREIVHGIQTATVVGPSTEEIYTDFHGRIKVQFHWDREGKRDEKSSCWVRVAQVWAGAGWGFVFLPRIGMEVVVEFLEGDPDRPIVVGCLYNGTNQPPYELDGSKTKSTIRTQSSPGNDPSKYNELRFEDAAGSEEVFIHAQKDFNEVVEHDHNTTVHNDQSNTVDGNQTQTVKKNQTESVGGEQSMTVSGNRTKTIKKSEHVTITNDHTVKIDGLEDTKIKGTRTEDVTGHEKVTLHAARETIITGLDKLDITGPRETYVSQIEKHEVTGNSDVKLKANANLTVTSKYEIKANTSTLTFNAGKVDLDAANLIDLHNGAGDVKVTSNAGKVVITAATELQLKCGPSSITLKSDGTITVNAPTKVTSQATGGTVVLEPTGVSISGPKISSSAQGTHEIQGALVKIN